LCLMCWNLVKYSVLAWRCWCNYRWYMAYLLWANWFWTKVQSSSHCSTLPNFASWIYS
jgi:hypothetical protein